MNTLRVALAQINPTVGAFEGNIALILDYLERARQSGADLVAFPQLAIAAHTPPPAPAPTPNNPAAPPPPPASTTSAAPSPPAATSARASPKNTSGSLMT